MHWRYSNSIILLVLIFVIIQGCENEVELNCDSNSLPVVYCLLDQDSEDQYLRLGKTYTGQEYYENQIPPADSLVLPGYRDIYIEEWNGDDIEAVHYFTQTENIQKDTGLFPVESIAVYQARFNPKPETQYVLYVYFPEQQKVVSGEITSIGKTELIDPAPIHVRQITFKQDRGYTLRYISAPNVGVYQGLLKIYYSEATESGIQFKSFDAILPLRYVSAKDLWVSQTISPGSFFNSFSENIEILSDVERELISLDFTLIAAGQDLAFFVNSQSPTFWMNMAQYTNLDNGFGIFSSVRSTQVSNLQFSDLTKLHLATDSLTRELNFIIP